MKPDLSLWQSRWAAAAPPEARQRLLAEGPAGQRHMAAWVADAVYGANDGLGAVFGIVAGVAGYSHSGHIILVSGLAGMLASALSMGVGAYLSAKAAREVREVQLARAQAAIERDAGAQVRELAEVYEAHGLPAEDGQAVAERLAAHPEVLARALADGGLPAGDGRRPAAAGLTAMLSTAAGAFVPIVPFLFTEGTPAIAAATAISLAAHFAVGAAKSAIVPARPWWVAGLEMTLFGAAEGGLTYGIGVAAIHYLPR